MKSTGQAASAVTTGKVGDASAQPAWLYSFFLTSTVQKTIPVLNHPLTEVSMSIQKGSLTPDSCIPQFYRMNPC